MDPINEATSIMLVGMITVFFILFMLVVIGNVIIRLSNKYLPEVTPPIKSGKHLDPSKNTFAAIAAAIDQVTGGRGKVTGIKKL